MGIDQSGALGESRLRTYAHRCSLLTRAQEFLKASKRYERTARYEQASHLRMEALAELERIGLENLIVDPEQ